MYDHTMILEQRRSISISISTFNTTIFHQMSATAFHRKQKYRQGKNLIYV